MGNLVGKVSLSGRPPSPPRPVNCEITVRELSGDRVQVEIDTRPPLRFQVSKAVFGRFVEDCLAIHRKDSRGES